MHQHPIDHYTPLHPTLSYAVLIGGLTTFLLIFALAWPNLLWQRLSLLFMGLFYVAWGVRVHAGYRTLTKAVLLEYLMVSLVCVLLLWLVTL